MPVDGPASGELVADLQEHGLLQPIVRHGGRILGSRCRCSVGRHDDIKPRLVERSGASPQSTWSSGLMNQEAGYSLSYEAYTVAGHVLPICTFLMG
jgi:hypothetical protein